VGRGGSRADGSKSPTVLEILKAQDHKAGVPVAFAHESTGVADAIRLMLESECAHVAVRDSAERVVGFATQRDMLRAIATRGGAGSGGTTPQWRSGQGTEPRGWWDVPVSRVMTPSKDIVWLSPDDTLEEGRSLMHASGKRMLPVLSGATMLGIVEPRDIARYLHLSTAEGSRSAKDSWVSTVLRHKGMPLSTRLARVEGEASHGFALLPAVCSLPHPGKAEAGKEGEDAYLLGPRVIGVADGVGSWWEHGVDPKDYARALMHASRLSASSQEVELHPQQVLAEAWHNVQAAGVVGSSTVCLVGLHPHKDELRAANVGDSGFLIVRPNVSAKGSASLGTLDASGAAKVAGRFHVAFRSPQQLRAFNAPFQARRRRQRLRHAAPRSPRHACRAAPCRAVPC
jgi:protein phosphatase PTC7